MGGAMQIKIFTLGFDPQLGGFDDSAVQEFLKNKEVLSISEHFFIKSDVPYLTFIIKCNSLSKDDALASSYQKGSYPLS